MTDSARGRSELREHDVMRVLSNYAEQAQDERANGGVFFH